jgi:hypothetical protein
MSRSRHKKREVGGGVENPKSVTAYAGGDSNVMQEAKERKRGGRAHHGEGEKAKERHDHKKRARGGGVVKRNTGGKVGANRMPFSTAKNITSAKGAKSA